MNKKIRVIAILLSFIMIFQIAVPGVSAMALNAPIKVGVHKDASKGKQVEMESYDEDDVIFDEDVETVDKKFLSRGLQVRK